MFKTYPRKKYYDNLPQSAPVGPPEIFVISSGTQTDETYLNISELEKLFTENFCFDYDSRRVYYLALNYITRFHRYINTILLSEEFCRTFQENLFQIPDIPDYFALFNIILNKSLWVSEEKVFDTVISQNAEISVSTIYDEESDKNINSMKLLQNFVEDDVNILKKIENLNHNTQPVQKLTVDIEPQCIEPSFMLQELQDVDLNESESISTCYKNDVAINTTETKTNKQNEDLISFESNESDSTGSEYTGNKKKQRKKDRTEDTRSMEHFETFSADVSEKDRFTENIPMHFENKRKHINSNQRKISQLTKSCFNIVNIPPAQINLLEYSQKKLEKRNNPDLNLSEIRTTSHKFQHNSLTNVIVDTNRSKVRPHTPKKVRNMFDQICHKDKQLDKFKLQLTEGIEADNLTDPDSIILDDEEFETMSQTRNREKPKVADYKLEKLHPLKLNRKDVSKLSQKVLSAMGLFTEQGDIKPNIINMLEEQKNMTSNDRRNKPFRNKRQWDIQIHLKPKPRKSTSDSSLASDKSVISLLSDENEKKETNNPSSSSPDVYD